MRKLFILILTGLSVVACNGSGSGQSAWSADTPRNWLMLNRSPYGQTYAAQEQQDQTAHQGTFKVVLPISDDGRRSYTIIKLVRADCAKRMLQTVSSGAFGPDGDSFGEMPDLGWQPVKAKTSTEHIFNHLCGGLPPNPK
ncbi:MAG: hypothetical protein KIG68_06620 [Oxalobacter sp.]|nr:hypothetical protein [Oxalobacter sp.]